MDGVFVSASAMNDTARHRPRLSSLSRIWFTKFKWPAVSLTCATAAVAAFYCGVEMKSSPLLLGSAVLGFMSLQAGLGVRRRFTWTNDDIPRRVQRLEELIDHARTDVVILAGSFFHKVYDHPAVLMAFRRAHSRGVLVTLYHNASSFDPSTIQFRELAKEARWPVARLETDMPHVVIVDRVHVREELESSSDNASNKLALIRYDAPKRSRKLYDQLLAVACTAQAQLESQL